MISFLIPTYDWDCSALAAALDGQARRVAEAEDGFGYEIIVADDGSPADALSALRAGLSGLPCCRLIALPQNVGRARIRNLLVAEARYPHVVIMDSDARVCTPDFVRRYWACRDRADVVCGSLRNPADAVRPGCELRARYEIAAERQRTVAYRSAHPYACFTTFNVMFRKAVFDAVRFDERCTEYGYEDTLLGLKLRDGGFSVLHIDNPLIHEGIDTNASFLGKTEAAMRTLSHLGAPLQGEAGPSRLCVRLRRLHLLGAFRALFRLSRRLLRRNLLGPSPSLRLFNFYKAGYYSTLTEEAG